MRDGEPCRHPGCLSHISHPCEVCGRIGGTQMSAPKCKECKHCSDERSLTSSINNHYCTNKDNRYIKQNHAVRIPYHYEIQSSPKWCPKRLEIQKEGKK